MESFAVNVTIDCPNYSSYIIIKSITIWRLCCYSAILSLLSYSGKMSPMNTREELYHMTDEEMVRLKIIDI